MTTYHLITLFPESTESYLNASILKRAQEKGLIALKYYNPRDFTISAKKGAKQTYAERRVDDRPYGGGPGMVIEALPVIKAIESAVGKKLKTKSGKAKVKIIFFSPAGKQFTNEMAETFKKYTDIVFVCGRYEGIDARVKKAFPMVDISVGPFVITGGELAAMIMIDAITRRIPGVLGDNLSIEEERIASSDVYTRPEVIEFKGKKYRVPKILLSGHHAKMDQWRLERRADEGQGKKKK
ncbi:MAG: tRNA (guanosine(37)-N1)-methyltransferase TrmD [Candidatus Pacebacteria bacterium]|nr:tRNA (guanosine(37)-N1)-methyltransferase TrmD [Candidatus Paceibacterota bacterium]